MPDTTRTFVAVPVPETLAPRLRKLQQVLGPDVPEVRWVVAPPFHVTLAFLGDIPHTDLNAVCKAVAEAAVGIPRLELKLGPLGAFPDPTRPRVVWAGVSGPGLDGLHALQAAVAGATARLGYPGDDAAFRPHVTLGRGKSGRERGRARGRTSPPPATRDLTALLHRYRNWSAGPFTATEAVAYASSLTPEGPVYTPLTRAPLRGQPTRE